MIHSSFPRYTDFDPLVPVWCVTPELSGCIHRFFDTSPISPSGRYLAVFQMPFEDRRPGPGEKGNVCVIDLESGQTDIVAETCGWEQQMGCNINWGSSDHELFFNDVDTSSWQPFAWKLDPLSGKKQRLEGTVYHASPDGRWLISSNLTTMIKTQPGYGVVVPEETVRWNVGAVDDDGFYITDTLSGEKRLLISIREILDRADPPVLINYDENPEIYGFHSKFNPQGDRLMLSLRWFPAADAPQQDRFGRNEKVDFAWVTMKLDGSELHCPVGPEEWVKGGHHATWFPDSENISMNLQLDGDEKLWLVQAHQSGEGGLKKMREDLPGSGHPTVHPDGIHLLTDTYTFEPLAYGDGTTPLRWINLKSGEEKAIVRINTATGYEADPLLRVDPHPAWDRSWRYVTFNAFTGGTRRVFIADMQNLLQ